MKIRKILFPTDLSPHAETAKAFATMLAKQQGAELLLLHSVLTHAHDFRQLGDMLSDFFDKLEKDAGAELEKETTRLKQEGLVASYAVERSPSAYEAIESRIERWKPDLVVMGTHGRSGLERWFLGSVAEKVVRHAPVNVLTVRPASAAPGAIRKVLVPVDFSEGSRRAVTVASELKREDAELVLVHVVVNPAFAGLHPGEYVRVFAVDPGLPERLRDRLKEWMKGEAFEADVREGEDVAASILAAAGERSADLIVMGTKGLTGLDYFLMGSVAEKVVRQSPVPVLSVK